MLRLVSMQRIIALKQEESGIASRILKQVRWEGRLTAIQTYAESFIVALRP